ncbi:ribonuclease III [Pleurocapsales cyanobacterium LEGE 10410]|nr:ribonuclease III [Pleurocapsales cyanobacterium LEGE 10410]
MSNNWDSSRVESKIGINFKHDQTLRLALIHPSYAKQINEPENDNQRLEFLGEAILNLVIVEYLYWHFSHFQLGKLKALRDKITETDRLTQLWYDLQLGEAYPFLGLKEERHRLRIKSSNPFEKAFKALVGAIYLDRGFSQARNWLHKHLLVPLLKRYLKPELEHSASDKQLELLGESLLQTVTRDYLYSQILQVQPSQLRLLERKLTAKESQNKYLKLSKTAWHEVCGDRPQPKSFKTSIAQIYLHFDSENSKSSFRKTSSHLARHFFDDDEVMRQAIALLLKDGKPQKWIIHNMMGYPSNKYNQGRERYYELIGQPK